MFYFQDMYLCFYKVIDIIFGVLPLIHIDTKRNEVIVETVSPK